MSTKLRLAIVAILLAMDVTLAASPSDKASGTGGSKNTILASSKRYEAFERKLSSYRSLSENATVATQTARSLFQMGKSAPPSLGGLVLEASCAAFIACGADASYADARKALGNPKDFESRVLDCCQICGGAGRIDEDCRECHGSGRCPVPSCNGGRRYVPKLGVVSCPTCKGTSRCQDCRGTGKQRMRCASCGGVGRKINRDSAQELYRERIDAAIEECRRHEVVVVSDIGGSGTTLAKATADALVNAVRKIHGPDAAATQKILGTGDKTIVKDYMVTSKEENESGLFEVRANVLVAKVLQGAASGGNTSDRFFDKTIAGGRHPADNTSPRVSSVDSRNMHGASIGALNPGDEVSFRYLGGEWTNWRNNTRHKSPDDPMSDTVCRLAIINQDDPKAVVAVVPTSTAHKAFHFSVPRNGTYAVRMNEDLYEYGMEAGEDNDGSVRYEIQITRASGSAPFDSAGLFGDERWN